METFLLLLLSWGFVMILCSLGIVSPLADDPNIEEEFLRGKRDFKRQNEPYIIDDEQGIRRLFQINRAVCFKIWRALILTFPESFTLPVKDTLKVYDSDPLAELSPLSFGEQVLVVVLAFVYAVTFWTFFLFIFPIYALFWHINRLLKQKEVKCLSCRHVFSVLDKSVIYCPLCFSTKVCIIDHSNRSNFTDDFLDFIVLISITIPIILPFILFFLCKISI